MNRRTQLVEFLTALREKIIKAFESLETGLSFERKPWQYKNGEGGGEIGLLRGKIFEKAAVNWSMVSGSSFPGSEAKGPFFATGVSLITHMVNPHVPTVHMNIRYIETLEKFWFGGGYDLTPMGIFYPEDKEHFHKIAKQTLDGFDPHLYPSFSQNAKEYFFIPHRQKERGVGGIFFDYFNTGNFEKDLAMWKQIGLTFLEAIFPIYQQRISQPYSEKEKEKQLELRAHYVEFNLLYDRGTKFGFQSGGNPEAILCSMPPLAKW
jgi:coproporphyrinogen III oxidase